MSLLFDHYIISGWAINTVCGFSIVPMFSIVNDVFSCKVYYLLLAIKKRESVSTNSM